MSKIACPYAKYEEKIWFHTALGRFFPSVRR